MNRTPGLRSRLCRITLALSLLVALVVSLPAGAQPTSSAQALVTGVDAIGMTVAEMDRSLDFYTRVLTFQKASDVEVSGPEYEQMELTEN